MMGMSFGSSSHAWHQRLPLESRTAAFVAPRSFATADSSASRAKRAGWFVGTGTLPPHPQLYALLERRNHRTGAPACGAQVRQPRATRAASRPVVSRMSDELGL